MFGAYLVNTVITRTPQNTYPVRAKPCHCSTDCTCTYRSDVCTAVACWHSTLAVIFSLYTHRQGVEWLTAIQFSGRFTRPS